MRVQRSIASILAKCEVSMRRLEPFREKREKEFEEYCDRIGILYSPNSY